MDIKLICTDIDGTLIGDGRRGIPQINKTMLQKATAMGIPVALVSGRGPGGIRPLLEDCGIRGAMGCFSGALVLDEVGKELFGCPMEKPLALQVLAEIRNVTNVTVFQFGKEAWYKEQQGRWEDFEEEVSCIGVRYPSIEKSLKDPATSVYKLLAMSDDAKVMDALTTRLQSHFGDQLSIMLSSPCNLEIQKKGIGKGTAVRVLCAHYRTTPSSAVAFGDYFNDIDMFHAAGTSVAMGNAPQQVKAEATLIAPNACEGGLGLQLETWLA